MENQKKVFGLVGRNIDYSFSKDYFTEKFADLKLDSHFYENFDMADISDFSTIKNRKNILGLNVTIPYKEVVIPYLDSISEIAVKIGAVNTIKFTKDGKMIGYNTDWYGFKKSLEPMLKPHHQRALILGTGGASKAVVYAMEELGIRYTFVSRTIFENSVSYDSLNTATFETHQIVINCTPLGTYPSIDDFPPIPYEYFTTDHIAFDLIYNPAETEFLKRASANGAMIKNGYEMLVFQAEKAWEIWNNKD